MLRLKLILISFIFIFSSYSVNAINQTDNELNQSIENVIQIRGKTIRIQNSNGKKVEIYDITGIKIKSFFIDSNDKIIYLELKKGIYIIKIDKYVRKIIIS